MSDDDHDDPGSDDSGGDASEGAGAPSGSRRRRRRRRRGGQPESASSQPATAAPASPAPPRADHQRADGPQREGRAGGDRRDRRERREPRSQSDNRANAPRSPERRDNREPAPRPAEPGRRDHSAQAPEPPDDREDAIPAPTIAWGTDDDGPPTEVVLAADLPPDPPTDDEDRASFDILDAPAPRLDDDLVNACGVRSVPGGRTSWVDGGDTAWVIGDRVVIDSDRGQRVAWVVVAPSRRSLAGRDRLRRIIRRANETDLRGEQAGDDDRARALRIAKDRAAALRLPLKVFRVELSAPLGKGGKANVYYHCDERLDVRELVQSLGRDLGARIELRQLGVRDEAKAVGGIGSCGLTLCCTTWLPDFVPVSIKMAKDQGMVLSPTKVSGQCGRLKCCLVYEQAGYAELRKGLPKLGKRVIGARGEGRVVEVDVLRQRVRVSYAPGDSEVVPASEVRPLFPSGNQPGRRPELEPEIDGDHDDAALETDDPSAVAQLRPTAEPVAARIPLEPEPEPEPESDLAVPEVDLPDDES